LLRKFAFRPIIGLLKKREEEIKKGIIFTKEAEERLNNADSEKKQIIEKAKQQALITVQEAQVIAKNQKEEILRNASQKAEQVIEEAQRLANQERLKINEVIYQDASFLIKKGLEKVLLKIPAESRDNVLIEEALKELKSLKLKNEI